MNEAATATAPAQQAQGDFRIEVPTKSRDGARYVFTVADMIASRVKATNPLWAYGGVIRDNAHTLKYANGYVRRCEITELRQFMDSDQAVYIEPTSRRHMPARYNITENGQTREVGKQQVETLRGVEEVYPFLYTPFYPVDEIGTLTGQIDGLVEMPVQNGAECQAAQEFLFPNWNTIKDDPEAMPPKASQLRAHFLKRLAAAAGNEFCTKIALAAIQSCDQFRSWGTGFASGQAASYKEAEKKGWALPIGSDMELVCEQLGLARPDMLNEQATERMDKLTDVMLQTAENQNKFFEMQMKNGGADAAATPPPAVPQALVPAEPSTGDTNEAGATEAAPATCLATTGKGEPCKNEALADGFCKHPYHNAEAEAAKAEHAEKEAEQADNG